MPGCFVLAHKAKTGGHSPYVPTIVRVLAIQHHWPRRTACLHLRRARNSSTSFRQVGAILGNRLNCRRFAQISCFCTARICWERLRSPEVLSRQSYKISSWVEDSGTAEI